MSMLNLLCTARQKKSTENNKCPNLEKADCNNKLACLFLLNFSIATVDYETKSWHHTTIFSTAS
jgi:hypothetical protein